MSPERGQMQIGATLRDARRRMGLEVREVEERTKIRARYLRALENEDWEALPAPAYVRGFLRTYGQVLGLDGEMLADEFRRGYREEIQPSGPSPSEPLLSERRSPVRAPSRGPLLIGVVGAIVVLLVLLGLLGGGSDDDGRDGRQQARQGAKQNGKGSGKGGGSGPKPLQKVDATVRAVTSVDVCLVAGNDTALIDGQVLQAGTKEPFEKESKRYRLDLRSPGTAGFRVGSENRRLEVDEPASFEGNSRGISEVEYRGPDCP